ncbi:MAG TPA: tetratricopeptide repeat protein [Tissierellaceae bacterium]
MEIVDSYFKKHIDKITFLELKKDTVIGNGKYSLKKEIPLPIKTDSLISGIKEGILQDEINLAFIIDGIIYLIGIDPDFPYIKEYKEILYGINDQIENYIFYHGIKAVDKKDNDTAAIYFRALKCLNPKNVDGIFNYALTLEEIGKKFFDMKMEDKGMDFIKASTKELESILDLDDRYPLAYYKLGYHYKFYGNFLKAKLIWSQYLTLDKDELRLQEIREELDIIEDDAEMEKGLIYLNRNEFKKAIDIFQNLMKKYDKLWTLKYYLGVCYKATGNLVQAVELFYDAIELNKNNSDVYNELGICLVNIGEIEEAIDVFSEGINNAGEDYKLIFNRGLCYWQLGKLKDAHDDISRAYNLMPTDSNIKAQKERLDKLLNLSN